MAVIKKNFRYYYWLSIEFFKKHLKLVIISFLISFLFIIGIISLTPFFEDTFTNKTDTYGIVGDYDFNNLPDEIYNKISTGLLYIDDKGNLKLTIASSWEIRNNGREYSFNLKKGLLWNDGKEFSAADIRYQFKDVQIKVIDKNTLDFVLSKPLLSFPTYLKKPIIKYPLVGVAGLYKIGQIKTKYGKITELDLEPNSKNLSYVRYRFYQNENQLITAYKKGEISSFTIIKKSIADNFSDWKNTKIVKSVDYSKLMTVFFNFNNQLLKEKNIRDAISKGIDPDMFKDLGVTANGPLPPISWAYNSTLKPQIYDPDSASTIIKKTISASEEAQMNITTYYDYYDIADQVVSSLNKIGLNSTLSLASYGKPANFDVLVAFWKVPDDPDQYYFWHSTQVEGNIGGYKNVKIDKLLEDGRNTMAVDERKKIYFDFQRIIADDPPAIFLFYPYVYTIERKP